MRGSTFLLAFVLTAVGVSSAQTGSKDDAALTSLIKQMTAAQVAYDAPALNRILTADYIEVSPVGDVDHRDKVLGFYKPESEPPGITTIVDVSDVSIRNYGKFAVVIVQLNYAVAEIAQPVRSMRATFVCRSEKGGWKIASAQYTGIRPAQPPKK